MSFDSKRFAAPHRYIGMSLCRRAAGGWRWEAGLWWVGIAWDWA